MKKLYVDDLRPCPEGWDIARDYWQALELMSYTKYDVISLDHDIDSFADKEYTGYDILCMLEERRIKINYPIPHILIHTANAAVAAKMRDVADKLNKMGNP